MARSATVHMVKHADDMERSESWGVVGRDALPGPAAEFIAGMSSTPPEFEAVMTMLDSAYTVVDASFKVGDVQNAAGENMGSAKILSFAKVAGLSAEDALSLFGTYYREDVLGNPDGTDHANIRSFVKVGWDGVTFPYGPALLPKSTDLGSMKELTADETLAKSDFITGEDAEWGDSDIWIP